MRLPNSAHFRHLVVYPPLMREIERQWTSGAEDPRPASADRST